MSIANALGEMFRRELEAQMVPLQQAVRRMEDGLEALEDLRSVTYRLAPLISRLGSMAGVRTPSVLPEPAQTRGAGRGRKAAGTGAVAAKGPGRRARTEGGGRGCAVIGCKRQSRSKGYCSAHYQKLRLLMKTNRRPAEWVDDASPHSVQDVLLPRGRAASKALKEAATAARTAARTASKAARKAASSAAGKSKRAARKKKGGRGKKNSGQQSLL